MLHNGSNKLLLHNGRINTFVTRSAAETRILGAALGKAFPPNTIIGFFGDLGAGKTTFIKGLASGALGSSGEEVSSPTFTYLNIYQGSKPIFHFDLYRLRDADEFLSMGFDEMFDAGGICCIEWVEKIAELLPREAIRIQMTHLGNDERRIEVMLKD